MKYKISSIIIFSIISFTIKAQQNTICLIKYKDYKTNLGTYNYWFDNFKLISSNEPNLKKIYLGGFPVLMNNKMTTQTDTIKYNKEFNEFINDIKEQNKKRKERVIQKAYNSDVLKTTIYLDDVRINYIVVDTLAKMNSWQILNDTATIMGYKCQQAVINHNQDKYYAWFTTQLPYNAGPDGFRGLPGVILKVSNVSASIGFEAIEILIPFKGLVPNFDEIGEVISQSQWQKIAYESRRKSKEAADNRRKQIQKENESKNQ